MIGKNSDFLEQDIVISKEEGGRCEILALWTMSRTGSSEWIWVKGYQFQPEDVGLGMWIYVENNCRLNLP